MYPPEILAKMIDFAVLQPDATEAMIREAAAQARERHFACLCVQPCWVAVAAEELQYSDVKVCSVVGFPHGANMPQIKAAEAKLAVAHGAQELDMVMNIGALKSERFDLVREDIEAVASIANVSGLTRDGNEIVLKVIIEIGLLTPLEVKRACKIVAESGADFVKTGTGLVPTEVTPKDIRVIRDIIGTNMGIKVAGGIHDLDTALRMIDSGANRIGSSAAIEILEEAIHRPKTHASRRPRLEAEPMGRARGTRASRSARSTRTRS